jgi:predicted nuclease of predicted toxin-antitoxin system
MRVLLDECLPSRLKKVIAGHEVSTVSDAGWVGKSNGELLGLAGERFDVFVTIDKNLPAQQNLQRLTIGVIILGAVSNRFQDLEPLVPELLQALPKVRPGDLVRLGG